MPRRSMRPRRQACEAISPAGCSGCSLAYECERKRNGETTPWPLIALAMLAAMAALSAMV
jgi:hypothetical protein